jgi:hypothetical protein
MLESFDILPPEQILTIFKKNDASGIVTIFVAVQSPPILFDPTKSGLLAYIISVPTQVPHPVTEKSTAQVIPPVFPSEIIVGGQQTTDGVGVCVLVCVGVILGDNVIVGVIVGVGVGVGV